MAIVAEGARCGPWHWPLLKAKTPSPREGSAFAKRLGHRTTLGVPLPREGVAIGTIQLRRAKVNPVTDKQIASAFGGKPENIWSSEPYRF